MEAAILTGSSEVLIAASESIPQIEILTIEELTKILGSTVKHDDTNKVITFLGMLLTYTEEDQINIGYLAESSTGKSYIPLEISQYFPEEDVITSGYASPTAFFHDYSRLTKKGEKFEFYVDLEKKILLFLDQPHPQVLERLRPILSHDKKEIQLHVTDRNKNEALRTKHIVIRGFATVVFCCARFNMDEQEKTRLLLLSPETTQEKLNESIKLKVRKECNRRIFAESLNKDLDRNALLQRIKEVKQANIKQIIISEELSNSVLKRFNEKHKKLIPRNQRDIGRLLAMIKANALLNFDKRQRNGDDIAATQEDIDAGFKLYENVSEANELGLSPEIYSIYVKLKTHLSKHMDKYLVGMTINDYQAFYEDNFYRKADYDNARETLKVLTSMSLLVEQSDYSDRRLKRYLLPECVPKSEISTQ